MSRAVKLVLVAVGLVFIGAWLAPEPTAEQQAERQRAKVAEKAADEARAVQRAAEQRKYTAIASAKNAVLARLKDPESAKFGKVVFREDGVVCGYVNAKNSFGGYAGEKAFISLGSQEMTWLHGESKDFESTWNKRCAS